MIIATTESRPLPEDELAPVDKIKIFVSYSRRDSEFVGQIADALSARDDIHVFRDSDDILPTEEWKRRLEDLIAQADTIVFCLSPNSAASEVCAWEAKYAEGLNKRVAPIVVEDVDYSLAPPSLAKLNYILFTDRGDLEQSLESLVEALRTDIDWIREHTRIGELARRWKLSGNRRDQLLRGLELRDVEQWAQLRPSNAPALTETIWEFVQASRAEIRATIWRTRWVTGLLASLLVGVSALGSQGLLTYENLDRNIYKPFTKKVYEPARLHPLLWNVERRPLNDLVEEKAPRGFVFRECSNCPEMIIVPAGSFLMGSKHGPINEQPLRQVKISTPFAVSRYEVKFSEWEACVVHGGCTRRPPDQGWGRGDRPVMNVSWNHLNKQYLPWLRNVTGQNYRLPTEAEWEYVARAGSKTRYFWGDEIGVGKAHCFGCGSKAFNSMTAPTGSFAPNLFGVYDTHCPSSRI